MIHNDNARTDLLDLFHIMRCVNDRGTLPVQLQNPLQNPVPALRIDGHSRFIHQNKLWLMYDSAGNIQPTQQSARQLFRKHLPIFRKPCKRKCLFCQRPSSLFIRYIQPAKIIYILLHSHFFKYSDILWHHADLTLQRIAGRMHLFVKYRDRSLIIF